VTESVGILETIGLVPTMAAVDAMEKSALVRVLQCELNDFYGVVTKITGKTTAVATAIAAGRRVAERMGGRPVAATIFRPDPGAMKAIVSKPEFNPLIQQEVVFFPQFETVADAARPRDAGPAAMQQGASMSHDQSLALGFIETQGFTAVFEAIDAACKAANVEVVGKEKLGGGYVTVVVRGELSAVTTAVETGKTKVGELGKLIAAHVVARPSSSVLALLPKL
jgi:carbon dioxide concentrating mechanism protein CcmO